MPLIFSWLKENVQAGPGRAGLLCCPWASLPRDGFHRRPALGVAVEATGRNRRVLRCKPSRPFRCPREDTGKLSDVYSSLHEQEINICCWVKPLKTVFVTEA